MASPDLHLILGPLLYLWDGEAWRDFYFRIADEAPVDTVVVGEVTCSKRAHFILPYLDEVIHRLQRAGKTVRMASLALVTLAREEQMIGDLAELALTVEINDLSALAALKGKPCTVGPFVNVYNSATAEVFGARGVTSICLPPELPLSSIREIAFGARGIDFEVFAFGRVPLAMSARCAHARVKGNVKDNCQFVCGEEPDGLPVKTLDDQDFLIINGVQTMSHTCQTLVDDIPSLRDVGIKGLRLSPQHCDMVAVAELYRQVIDGTMGPGVAIQRLAEIYPRAPVSNGFIHGIPGAEFINVGRELD